MKNLRKQDDYWKPCRPGTILSVSDSKFQRQRRRFLIQSAMSGVVAAAGICSAIFVVAHRKGDIVANANGASTESNSHEFTNTANTQSNEPVRLTCVQVKKLATTYVTAIRLASKERTSDQDQLVLDFAYHLDYCESCSTMVREAVQDV